jgi:diaminohydroxyphosphoribosylaminopyrimidine deaminase/5-amino-6-(5-phosphoribosylamino)uracil reductase
MDEKYMKMCIDLASKGFPKAMPNPLVGCIIVYRDKIIGTGYHQVYGENHAEVNAINSVEDKSLLNDSTLYVTLEPCVHFGKTPPCANLIVQSKIPRVVIGSLDTFSEVNGKGIEALREAGVTVKTSVLEGECRALNKRFFTFHEKKRPYIILKWAKSSDGLIAPKNQTEPFWMTGKESKKLVHQWRGEETAILVGKNTVIIDNPLLTTREIKGDNPIRILIDKNLSLATNYAVFNNEATTLVVNESKESQRHVKVDFNSFFPSLMKALHQRGIQSLIVEGGAITLNSFIASNYWDEARVFTSKKILGNGIQSPVIELDINENTFIDNDKLDYYFNI